RFTAGKGVAVHALSLQDCRPAGHCRGVPHYRTVLHLQRQRADARDGGSDVPPLRAFRATDPLAEDLSEVTSPVQLAAPVVVHEVARQGGSGYDSNMLVAVDGLTCRLAGLDVVWHVLEWLWGGLTPLPTIAPQVVPDHAAPPPLPATQVRRILLSRPHVALPQQPERAMSRALVLQADEPG
ncbi:MAG: hypothetical protein ACK4FW_13280, partial [Stenotrophomonas sp.]